MTDTARIFQLIYRSQLTAPPESRGEAIDAIVDISRRTNAELAITGALLIWQELILQTLEGPEDSVVGLYAKIACDDRHEALTLLRAQHVDARVFGKWSMVRPFSR